MCSRCPQTAPHHKNLYFQLAYLSLRPGGFYDPNYIHLMVLIKSANDIL